MGKISPDGALLTLKSVAVLACILEVTVCYVFLVTIVLDALVYCIMAVSNMEVLD